MNGEEKFNTCEHRSTFARKAFIGCPCRKQTRDVYSCNLKKLPEVQPNNCEECQDYKQK